MKTQNYISKPPSILEIKYDKEWGYIATETRLATDVDIENVNLIASAPDLLEALKALHSCHRAFSQSENWTTLDDEARKFAEAAIAKAKGEV